MVNWDTKEGFFKSGLAVVAVSLVGGVVVNGFFLLVLGGIPLLFYCYDDIQRSDIFNFKR